MMRDYEPDVSQLLALYQQLEDDIVEDMVRRIMRMGFVSESTAYQAEVLQTAGILYDDVIQMVADRAGKVKPPWIRAGSVKSWRGSSKPRRRICRRRP